MRPRHPAISACILLLLATTLRAADAPTGLKDAPTKAGFPKFKVQEIATDLTIGYAVLLTDINNDKRPDIVVVDKHRVVWYENPTWKRRTILQGKTKPDNVCITALDIDHDGQLELVLGAGWKPMNSTVPGTLQWLKRGKTLDDEWTMYPIPCDEPLVHRVRVADIDGDGKPEIIMAPLMGRGATAKGNWMDGRPVRILAYRVPKEPTKAENWKPEVICDSLHVVHNFWPLTHWGFPTNRAAALLIASYEGVFLANPKGMPTPLTRVHEGNQSNPKGSRGASEVKATRFQGNLTIATIEPWHGNEVVIYIPDRRPGETGFRRHVIDDHLRWGHALAFARLTRTEFGGEPIGGELIVGVRDNPKPGDSFAERRGVRIYKCTDGTGAKWDRLILEDGGVAVEDLAVADLNGDGRPDIVAVGRQTGNCRIYWNQGK